MLGAERIYLLPSGLLVFIIATVPQLTYGLEDEIVMEQRYLRDGFVRERIFTVHRDDMGKVVSGFDVKDGPKLELSRRIPRGLIYERQELPDSLPIIPPAPPLTATATNLGSLPAPTTLMSMTNSLSFPLESAAPTITATHPQFSDAAPGGQPTTTADNSSPTSSSTDPMNNPDPDTSDTQDQRNSSLLNYYFVFLALFVILLIGGIYFIHKRKRAMKAQARNSGQNALRRDLDGWDNARRWVHGGWRVGPSSGTARREEGLNEYGEAPPPYEPPPPNIRPQSRQSECRDEHGIAMPMRTLSRDDREASAPGTADGDVRPPSYPGAQWPNGSQASDIELTRPAPARS